MTRNKKSGFTLVELMVVAVIVAILAAVAIPLMSGNRQRAMMTEAEAGLGTMRTSLRAMFAQSGKYTKDIDNVDIAAGAAASAISGINVGDLDGRYFNDAAYKISAVSDTTYTLTATGSDSTADGKDDVAGIVVTLDDKGAFVRTTP